MPAPQLNGKSQTRERPTYTEILWEQLHDTKNEVKETRKELNQRMDRLEHRIDRLEEELKSTRQELNANINDLRKVMQSSTNHGQIATISTVGIALGVLYSIFSK